MLSHQEVEFVHVVARARLRGISPAALSETTVGKDKRALCPVFLTFACVSLHAVKVSAPFAKLVLQLKISRELFSLCFGGKLFCFCFQSSALLDTYSSMVRLVVLIFIIIHLPLQAML